MSEKRFFTTLKVTRSGYGGYDEFNEVEVNLAELLAKERYDYMRPEIDNLEIGQRMDGSYFDTIIRLKDAE